MKNLNGKANVDELGDTELLGWCKMVHYCQVVHYSCRFVCKSVMDHYMNQFTLYSTKFDYTTSTKPQILTTKIFYVDMRTFWTWIHI